MKYRILYGNYYYGMQGYAYHIQRKTWYGWKYTNISYNSFERAKQVVEEMNSFEPVVHGGGDIFP